MITIDGKTRTVPSVYGSIKVINSGSKAIPPFNGLLIVGNARQGVPYNAGKGYEVITAHSNLSDVRALYGDSDLSVAFAEAQKGGAGMVYLLNPAPLTKAGFTVKDTNVSPKSLFNLVPVSAGAPSNDIRLDVTNSGGVITITFTPVKDVHFLTADLDGTGSKTFSLDSLSGLAVGDVVKIADNDSVTYQSGTITDLDQINKRVILDTTITSVTQAKYARLFKQDLDNKKQKSWNATDAGLLNSIISWINATGLFTVTRPSNFDGDITLINGTYADYLMKLPSATKGTSPVATETVGGDFDLCAGALPKLLEEFTSFTGGRIRVINLVSGVGAVHSTYLGLASTLRTNQYSVVVVAGCNAGDINLQKNDNDYPIVRAKALNSDDFILAGMGLNDQPAYKSLAPQVAGMISANRIERNLTRDPINAVKVEYFFGEFNKESHTAPMLNAGVLIVETTKQGFVLSQAVNTYQKRDSIWNASDKKSYLIQQRQIVDYVYEGYKSAMETGVGSEGFTETVAVTIGLGTLDRFLADGVITDRKIVEVTRVGNAIITKPAITPLDATDFVGFELQVEIPN